MNYVVAAILTLLLALVSPADTHADWRWSPPVLAKQTVKYHCNTQKCLKASYLRERKRLKRRIDRYDNQRAQEWRHWIAQPIPNCTWYGESGTAPQFAPIRYITWNSTGSGARGKYQMMQGTYADNAKYFDWSPLDQEIAGHQEFWKHGTAPWQNC